MHVHFIHIFLLLPLLSLVFASTLPTHVSWRRDQLALLHDNHLGDTEAIDAASITSLIRRDWRDAHRNIFSTTIAIGGGWVAHYNILDFIGSNVQVAIEELQEFYHQILELGAMVWAHQPPQRYREASLGGITLLLQSNAPVISWEWIQGFLHDTVRQPRLFAHVPGNLLFHYVVRLIKVIDRGTTECCSARRSSGHREFQNDIHQHRRRYIRLRRGEISLDWWSYSSVRGGSQKELRLTELPHTRIESFDLLIIDCTSGDIYSDTRYTDTVDTEMSGSFWRRKTGCVLAPSY